MIDEYGFGIDVWIGGLISMLCCLKVQKWYKNMSSDSCFWQLIDEEGKGWLQEGLYALRRNKAHNTSASHTIDVKETNNVLEVF